MSEVPSENSRLSPKALKAFIEKEVLEIVEMQLEEAPLRDSVQKTHRAAETFFPLEKNLGTLDTVYSAGNAASRVSVKISMLNEQLFAYRQKLDWWAACTDMNEQMELIRFLLEITGQKDPQSEGTKNLRAHLQTDDLKLIASQLDHLHSTLFATIF